MSANLFLEAVGELGDRYYEEAARYGRGRDGRRLPVSPSPPLRRLLFCPPCRSGYQPVLTGMGR